MRKLLARLVFFCTPHKSWYAIKHKHHGGWIYEGSRTLISTDVDFGPAIWFDEPAEAWLWMSARCHYGWHDDYQLVKLDVQFATNIYRMTNVPWSI